MDVGEPDEPWRVDRARTDAEDAAVPALAQRLLVEHFDLELARAGHIACGVREFGRVQVAGGGVDQVAGETDCRGDDLGPS